MNRLIISTFILALFHSGSAAQTGGSGIAKTPTPLSEVERVALPLMDNEALLQAELLRRHPGEPPRFAEAIATSISPAQYGLWEKLPDGREVWRLRIVSSGAHSLNFGFSEFSLPAGGRLYLYPPDGRNLMGPFTPSDNESHGELWTPLLEGDEAVIEIQLPANARSRLALRLAYVNHDFLGLPEVLSASCHLDAICGNADGWPIVDPYREVIQSVAAYGFGGDTYCSGLLVNNTQQDCTPYFLTAFHCNVNPSNAQTVVVYWNYQNSFCRQPNTAPNSGPGNGQRSNFNTGAIYRAGYSGSDFTLLELDDPIPPNARAYLAGWSRKSSLPQDTLACIHHPGGVEKRISFAFKDAYPGNWGNGSTEAPNGNHLIVSDWDVGSTEDGSSGAPLFNQEQRLVGQLHGGAASCSNDQFDAFGWFRYSWEGGGYPSTRLKDWLDPANSGALELDGRWSSACEATIFVEASNESYCIPGEAHFEVRVNEGFAGPVQLGTSGLPTAGFSASFSPNPALPGTISALTVSAYGSGLAPTNVEFNIHANDGFTSTQAEAGFLALTESPASPWMAAPADGQAGLSLAPVFEWNPVPFASTYQLQVATNSDFDSLAANIEGLVTPTFQGIILEPLKAYFCRVRAHNTCGTGNWSPTIELYTSAATCGRKAATNLPVPISANGVSVAISELYLSEPGKVAEISLLNLDISHTYVGDLSAFLQAPSGAAVQLFHRPGVPAISNGCWGAGLRLDFFDEALLSQEDLEETCGNAPAIAGAFQPLTPLSNLIGEPVAGTWRLVVIDHFDLDGGTIDGWELDLCRTYPASAALFFAGTDIYSCVGQASTTPVYVGAGFAAPPSLSVGGLPPGATADFDENPVVPGTFNRLVLEGLTETGDYPLTITASDGLSTYSCYLNLRARAAPEAPLLLLPGNQSPVFQGSLFFNWSPVLGVDTFLLEIARDLSFTQIVRKDIVIENYHSYNEPLSGGRYFWRVTALNYCGGSTSLPYSFLMEGPVSSSTVPPEAFSLKAFPNPATTQLHVQWDGPPVAEASVAVLFSLDGKEVYRSCFRGQATLPVAQLPAGIYQLSVRAGKRHCTRRILIQ